MGTQQSACPYNIGQNIAPRFDSATGRPHVQDLSFSRRYLPLFSLLLGAESCDPVCQACRAQLAVASLYDPTDSCCDGSAPAAPPNLRCCQPNLPLSASQDEMKPNVRVQINWVMVRAQVFNMISTGHVSMRLVSVGLVLCIGLGVNAHSWDAEVGLLLRPLPRTTHLGPKGW